MKTRTQDAQLVVTYIAGDRNSLASMYDLYASGLYDTAVAMLSDRHDAADAVHDVFCIAAERLNQLRDPDRLKPWLYTILRHEVYRRTKKRKRFMPTDFQSESVPEVVAAIDPYAEGAATSFNELAELVRSAAAGLDERDRLLLELSVRQGLTGADLADALGVTPQQSYSLVHRMRDRIEKSLGALTVAKMGGAGCNELARITAGWNGEFNVLVRKRVTRHIDECTACEDTRLKYAPIVLFGTAPAFVLPAILRQKILAKAQRIPIPSHSVHTHKGSRVSNHSRHPKFNSKNGFRFWARISRHGLVLIAIPGIASLLVNGLIPIERDDESIPSKSAGQFVAVSNNQVPEFLIDSSAVEFDVVTPSDTSQESLPTSTDVIDSSPITELTSTTTTFVAPPTPITTPSSISTTIPIVGPPITSTTTARIIFPLVTSTDILDFSDEFHASLVLTNNNSLPVNWVLTESSGYFQFVPNAGVLDAGAVVTVLATFVHSSATTLTDRDFTYPASLATLGAPTTRLTLSSRFTDH